ncbi:MAG: hypothetical protein RMY29_026255 [Nostoc sp. CreGUA01]|nr:hypothetical protein [Nostoc sp. CreGUA01]
MGIGHWALGRGVFDVGGGGSINSLSPHTPSSPSSPSSPHAPCPMPHSPIST